MSAGVLRRWWFWGALVAFALIVAYTLARRASAIDLECGDPAGEKVALFLWAAGIAGFAFGAGITGAFVCRRTGVLAFALFICVALAAAVLMFFYLLGALFAEPICLS
jgi:hypothetical protein